jgi:predicted MFS family arabinose efflux permease
MGVFFLQFNLLLLARGFHEDALGAVASAMGIGSIAGTLPAAFVLHRFGLRNTLLAAFLGGQLAAAVRVLPVSMPVLASAAFAGGFLFSFYAVSLAPAVAQFTTERSRPFGFSLVFALGIGMGVLAGIAGGQAPALLGLPLQTTLLAACGTAALGAAPLARLRFAAPQAPERKVYPCTRFIARFLTMIVIWHFATGLFNPFFNAYFATSLHMPLKQIGTLFSAAQLAQVFAVLCAPIVLRRLGAIDGVVAMQLATAGALASIALTPNPLAAAGAYAAYMAFQNMSEPGVYSLLMGGVESRERAGASALNFLAAFAAQALAAALAGLGVRRFGYSVVLVAAALIIVLAAAATRLLLRHGACPVPHLRSVPAQPERRLDSARA